VSPQSEHSKQIKTHDSNRNLMGTSLCPAWPRRSSAIRRRRFIASQTIDHFRFAAKLAGLSCPPTQFAACSVGRYTTSKIWQNSENGARCSSNGSTGDRDRERSETKPPGECGLIGERASCFSAASSTIRTGAWLKSSRRFFFLILWWTAFRVGN